MNTLVCFFCSDKFEVFGFHLRDLIVKPLGKGNIVYECYKLLLVCHNFGHILQKYQYALEILF